MQWSFCLPIMMNSNFRIQYNMMIFVCKTKLIIAISFPCNWFKKGVRFGLIANNLFISLKNALLVFLPLPYSLLLYSQHTGRIFFFLDLNILFSNAFYVAFPILVYHPLYWNVTVDFYSMLLIPYLWCWFWISW